MYDFKDSLAAWRFVSMDDNDEKKSKVDWKHCLEVYDQILSSFEIIPNRAIFNFKDIFASLTYNHGNYRKSFGASVIRNLFIENINSSNRILSVASFHCVMNLKRENKLIRKRGAIRLYFDPFYNDISILTHTDLWLPFRLLDDDRKYKLEDAIENSMKLENLLTTVSSLPNIEFMDPLKPEDCDPYEYIIQDGFRLYLIEKSLKNFMRDRGISLSKIDDYRSFIWERNKT